MLADQTTRDTENAYNAAVDLLEGNVRDGRGGRTYLLTEGRKWSYDEVAEGSRTVGAGLLERGLSPGDRLVLALGDSPEFVLTFWGAIRVGLIPVPVAQGLSISDLGFILEDSGARAIVCDESSMRNAGNAARAADTMCICTGDQVVEGGLAWSQLARDRGNLDAATTAATDAALWLYTSGTTGLPKAVMHSHLSLRAASNGLAHQVLGMHADDVILSVSRMFFAYGLGNSVYLPASVGASVVVNDGPILPARVAEQLERTSATLFFGVPAFFDGFARLSDVRLPSVTRAVLSAGEVLSPALFERFESRFGTPLLDGLGSTEMLHHITANRPDDVVPGSAGRALDGYAVEVRDRNGAVLEEGKSGELWVKGPTEFSGYWRRPELTARIRREGWVRTGDQVRIVEGRVYHEGRLDDLIKLGGVWVTPVEIEDVLRSHRDVTDSAVVATDDGGGVPTIKAYVLSERDDKAFKKELLLLCRQRLATFKIPKSFEVVSELPRTPTGKLRRFVLRG